MREKEKSQLKKRLLGLVINEPPYPHPITMSEVMVNDMSKPNIKPLLNFIEQEIDKAREEGRKEERDRIFWELDRINCVDEALPKNYSASSMQLGINRAKEIVLEKELSKLTTK